MKKVPNLSNATPAYLTDELGRVKDELKALKKEEGVLKGALIARLDEDETEVEGEIYEAVYAEGLVRSTLNASKIRADMDENWIAEHTQTTEYSRLTVKKK